MRGSDARRTILRAAESLFMARRYDQVTLDEVCRKARVGKGTIYRHFGGKESLYAQVLLAGLEELGALVERRAADAREPDKALAAVARALRRFYAKRSNLRRSLHSEMHRGRLKGRGVHQELRRCRRRVVDALAAILREGRRQGLYRGDIPASVAASLLLAMMRETGRSGPPGERPRERPTATQVTALFLHGIQKRGEEVHP